MEAVTQSIGLSGQFSDDELTLESTTFSTNLLSSEESEMLTVRTILDERDENSQIKYKLQDSKDGFESIKINDAIIASDKPSIRSNDAFAAVQDNTEIATELDSTLSLINEEDIDIASTDKIESAQSNESELESEVSQLEQEQSQSDLIVKQNNDENDESEFNRNEDEMQEEKRKIEMEDRVAASETDDNIREISDDPSVATISDAALADAEMSTTSESESAAEMKKTAKVNEKRIMKTKVTYSIN
uniref:Uncharacterized protein n=1 Tax=Setaria digitata TaxID=48799 RepID=A0A915PSE3_9BILA